MNKSSWISLLVTCLLITSVIPTGSAVPYPGYNLQKILLKQEGTAGQKNHSLDIRYLDSILQGIALHAGNYPPKFDSDDDRQHAILDIKMLTTMLNMALTDDNNPNPELLIRAATANRMAHNLDISGAADKASQQYQQLIRIDPENPSANFQYGRFLAESGKPEQGVIYLQKAWNLGAVSAGFGLALARYSIGDKTSAVNTLEAYIQKRPQDTDAIGLLKAIKSGKLKINKS